MNRKQNFIAIFAIALMAIGANLLTSCNADDEEYDFNGVYTMAGKLQTRSEGGNNNSTNNEVNQPQMTCGRWALKALGAKEDDIDNYIQNLPDSVRPTGDYTNMLVFDIGRSLLGFSQHIQGNQVIDVLDANKYKSDLKMLVYVADHIVKVAGITGSTVDFVEEGGYGTWNYYDIMGVMY